MLKFFEMQPKPTSSDHILRFNNIPQIKMVVYLESLVEEMNIIYLKLCSRASHQTSGCWGQRDLCTSKYNLVMQLKKERCLLLRKSHLHKSPKMSALQLRVGRSGLLLTSSPPALMTEERNHIILDQKKKKKGTMCYCGVSMSSIIEQGYGVGDVICLCSYFCVSLHKYLSTIS